MKLLIATPSYRGTVTTLYVQSLLATMEMLRSAGIEHKLFTLDADALISRARNKCAELCLDIGFDRILFIDSDIVWTPEHVKRLCDSDRDIVGGTYPMKAFPVTPNLNPLNEHYQTYGYKRHFGAFLDYAEKFADPNGEIEVRHVPTGFMMVKALVFKALQRVRPKYVSRDGVTDTISAYHDYFPFRIVSEIVEGHEINTYETEDWGFCGVAREMGFKIYLNTKVLVSHIGLHHYKF